jgi:urease subunit alpha
VEAGKFADLVIWKPALFGAKPEMIIKGGFIMAAKMGDANASIPTPQPVMYRNMFGASDMALKQTCITFVSAIAAKDRIAARLGLRRLILPVKDCRKLSKKDMRYNDRTGDIKVDPEKYTVTVDGKLITCEPAKSLSLARRYWLF